MFDSPQVMCELPRKLPNDLSSILGDHEILLKSQNQVETEVGEQSSSRNVGKNDHNYTKADKSSDAVRFSFVPTTMAGIILWKFCRRQRKLTLYYYVFELYYHLLEAQS